MRCSIYIILFFLYIESVVAQNWTEPVIIGFPDYATRVKNIVDSKDHIHVVFEVDEDLDHIPDNIYYTEFDDQAWSVPLDISVSDTNLRNPIIKIDNEGLVHTIWGALGNIGYSSIWHNYKKDKNWLNPRKVFQIDNDLYIVTTYSYDFDSRNRLHLIFYNTPWLKHRYLEKEYLSEITPIQPFSFDQDFKIYNDTIHLVFSGSHTGNDKSIYYSQFNVDSVRTDSSKSSRTLVHYRDGNYSSDPQIIIDKNERKHIIWQEGFDNNFFPDEIFHSYSDEGLIWSDAVNISHNGGTSFQPSIVIDSNNNIHIVWAQSLFQSSVVTHHIDYAFFDGEAWSEPEELFSPVNGRPSIAIDSEDYLHIVYDVKIEDKHRVMYSSNRSEPSGLIHEENYPQGYKLLQNYPNPFNSSTTITFSIPSADIVTLMIYDVKGVIINEMILNKQLNPGTYTIQWDGMGESGNVMPSGVYIYWLKSKNFTAAKKFILLL